MRIVYDRIFAPRKFFKLLDKHLVTPVTIVLGRLSNKLNTLVQPYLNRLEDCFCKCLKGHKWKQEFTGQELRELTKSLKGIDFSGDQMIQKVEMSKFVTKVYTSGVFTAKEEDLKESVKAIVESK